MSWTAKGSKLDTQSTGATTQAMANVAIGDLIVLIATVNSATIFANGISGGGVAWDAPQGHGLGPSSGWSTTVFTGTTTATGAGTATVTFSASNAALVTSFSGFEFASSVGSWVADKPPGFLDNTGAATFPSLTPTGAGDLYFGYETDVTSAVGPVTSPSGYVFVGTTNSNGIVYSLNCTAAAQAPVLTTGQLLAAGAILIRESGGGGAGAAKMREHAGRRKGRRHGAQRQVQQASFAATSVTATPLLPVPLLTSPPVTVQDGANW